MSDTAEATASFSPLLDCREVASYLKVSESTLSRCRSAETGPPFIKLGGIARYRQSASQQSVENVDGDGVDFFGTDDVAGSGDLLARVPEQPGREREPNGTLH